MCVQVDVLSQVVPGSVHVTIPCQRSQRLCIAVVHFNGMQSHYGGGAVKGLCAGEGVAAKRWWWYSHYSASHHWKD